MSEIQHPKDGEQLPLQKDEAAWEALKKLIEGAVAGALPPAPGVKPGTVAPLSAAFLEAKAGDVNPATLRGYAKYLKWLAKHFGDSALAAVDLAAVRARAASETWSDTHRANTLWCVNALLRWCGRSDRVPLPPKESRGGDSVIPEELHRRIVNETTGDFRQLVRFLWLTGCRPGEATHLTADAVDWDAQTIRLKKHKTRHKGKTRTIYPCPEALEVLADQRDKYKGAGHLFRGLRGKPLSLQAMTMRFQRVSEKVGHKVCSYSYRHTWATRALAAGESDTIVAAMMGHSGTNMIHKHYSHVGEQSRVLKGAAKRIAGRDAEPTAKPSSGG
jgi:integrase